MSIQTKTYDKEGKEAGTAELPEKVFGIELNSDLVHQVMVAAEGNRRQVSAHTKGRGDVSGGGKKPWAQKHTGKARHGSIRSPIWVGGGVSHGPTAARNFTKKINSKMRRKALCMVLSEKLRQELVVIVEDLQFGDSARKTGTKTKTLQALLQKLPCNSKSTIIALPEMQYDIIRAGNNLGYARTMQARELNVFDILNAKYLVMPKQSVGVIEQTFIK